MSRLSAETQSLPTQKQFPEQILQEQPCIQRCLYELGLVTAPSVQRRSRRPPVDNLSANTAPNHTDRDGRIERSIPERSARAKLYHLAQTLPKDQRQQILLEAKAREQVAYQFRQQKVVLVTMDKLGVQAARYVKLTPPANFDADNNSLHEHLNNNLNNTNQPANNYIEQNTNLYLDRAPIFLIPGLSNDLASVSSLAQELALAGRQVIVIAYPDSAMGQITAEFAQEVKKNNNLNLHADFFTAAIKEIAQQESLSEIEIWSLSAGGPIAAEVMRQQQTGLNIQNAVFIAPAGVKNQNKRQLFWGIAKETWLNLKRYTELSNMSTVVGAKNNHHNPHRQSVWNSLTKKITYQYQNWKELDQFVTQNVVFWVAGQDFITKGGTIISDRSDRIEVSGEIIYDQDGVHSTPITSPQSVIAQIHNALYSN